MTTKLKTIAPALLAATTLFLTACGSDDQTLQATPPATTAAPASSTAESSMTESSMAGSESSESESTESESESTEASPSESTESATSESSTSEPTESATSESSTSESTEPSTSESSTSSSSAATSAGNSKPVVIKAFAGKTYPAKVGSWVKAPGSGPGSVYDKGDADVVSSFLSDSDYASISTAVKTEKTPVSAGLCGGTGVEDSYTCYLKTTDGVINVAGDTLDDVVEFSNELAKALGSS